MSEFGDSWTNEIGTHQEQATADPCTPEVSPMAADA